MNEDSSELMRKWLGIDIVYTKEELKELSKYKSENFILEVKDKREIYDDLERK